MHKAPLLPFNYSVAEKIGVATQHTAWLDPLDHRKAQLLPWHEKSF